MCVTNTRNKRPVVLPSQTVSNLQANLAKGYYPATGAFYGAAAAKQSSYPAPTEYPNASFFVGDCTSSHHVEKATPKRRRKPQKPGKTAKQNDRHFVVHNYHDHSMDHDESADETDTKARARRGGVSVSFPIKLHEMLDQIEADGLSDVISWQPHGRAFVVHKPKEFVDHVLPKYFRQTKLTSFQRQLNLYGFVRLTRDPDNGGYYHELFLRGMPFLCKRMTRIKVKGTGFKAASSPDSEPDFYKMKPVGPRRALHQTQEDEISSGDETVSTDSSLPQSFPQTVPPQTPTFMVPFSVFPSQSLTAQFASLKGDSIDPPQFLPSEIASSLSPTTISSELGAFVPSGDNPLAMPATMNHLRVQGRKENPLANDEKVISDEETQELLSDEMEELLGDELIVDFAKTWTGDLSQEELLVDDDDQFGRMLEMVME